MITIGDKLRVIKETFFLKKGEVVRVTNVDKDGFVTFVFGNNFKSSGTVDAATCKEHFEKIVEEKKKTISPAIISEYIGSLMMDSEIEVFTTFGKCTIVSCELPNGFVIVESHTCMNPEDYNEDVGVDACIDKIASRIYELESYRMQDSSFYDCCTCEGCEDCCSDAPSSNRSEIKLPEIKLEENRKDKELDDCVYDSDINCKICEDYECIFNANSGAQKKK